LKESAPKSPHCGSREKNGQRHKSNRHDTSGMVKARLSSERFRVPPNPPRRNPLQLATSVVLVTAWLVFLLWAAINR